jgi:hypothetical protein
MPITAAEAADQIAALLGEHPYLEYKSRDEVEDLIFDLNHTPGYGPQAQIRVRSSAFIAAVAWPLRNAVQSVVNDIHPEA